jgi:hypothetical protein
MSASLGSDKIEALKAILGNAAIPTALKCAPWVATYMW